MQITRPPFPNSHGEGKLNRMGPCFTVSLRLPKIAEGLLRLGLKLQVPPPQELGPF